MSSCGVSYTFVCFTSPQTLFGKSRLKISVQIDINKSYKSKKYEQITNVENKVYIEQKLSRLHSVIGFHFYTQKKVLLTIGTVRTKIFSQQIHPVSYRTNNVGRYNSCLCNKNVYGKSTRVVELHSNLKKYFRFLRQILK